MVSLVRIFTHPPFSVSLILSRLTPTVGATSHCPLRRLRALPSPFAAAERGGRVASRRTRATTRMGGVARPMAAGRRWYQAHHQSDRISAV